jgi:hypothetical protein
VLDDLLAGRVDEAEALCHDFIRDLPGQAQGHRPPLMIFEARRQRQRALDLLRQAPDASSASSVLPLMQTLSERRRAGWMRKHFVLAKIQRARLTEESATTMQINFRSWRDTGITWLALDGVELAKMQRRAGHERIETTSAYVKMAEDLTGTVGQPFPAIPQEPTLAPRPLAETPPSRRRRREPHVCEEGPGREAQRAQLPPSRAPQARVLAERAGFEPRSGIQDRP